MSTASHTVRVDPRSQKITALLKIDHMEGNLDEMNRRSILTGKERVPVKLASVKELRAETREAFHDDLTTIFGEHVFVGVADSGRRLAAIQHLTKLYLVDYGAVSAELFYQIGLTEFGNFGSIRLNPSLNLKDLLKVALPTLAKNNKADSLSKNDNISTCSGRSSILDRTFDQIYSHREMLKEYFSLSISEDGQLETLPLLMQDCKQNVVAIIHSSSVDIPALSKLPNFLIRLGTHVRALLSSSRRLTIRWSGELRSFVFRHSSGN